MKKIIVILVLVCFANNNYAQNCIQLIENNLDYVETLPNEQLHFNFIFKNQCKDTIRVKNFIAGSKVKFNDFSKMILYPNERDTITISYISETSINEEYTNSEMIVFSNNQSFKLKSIYRTIGNPKIIFQRKNVNLGQIRVDSNYEYKFTFCNKYNSPVKISKCTWNNKKFKIIYPSKNILPNNYGEILLKFNTNIKEDSLSNKIKIFFSNNDSFILTVSSSIIFISGITSYDIETDLNGKTYPKTIKFKNICKDTLIVTKIKFNGNNKGTIKIKDSIPPNEEFEIIINSMSNKALVKETCNIIFNKNITLLLNFNYIFKDKNINQYYKNEIQLIEKIRNK